MANKKGLEKAIVDFKLKRFKMLMKYRHFEDAESTIKELIQLHEKEGVKVPKKIYKLHKKVQKAHKEQRKSISYRISDKLGDLYLSYFSWVSNLFNK
jgi:hypothetical protein